MECEYVSPKALQARDQSKHPQQHPCGLPGFLDSHPRTAPLQRHDSSGWGWCGDKATEQTNLPYLGIWHHDSAVSHRIRNSKKWGTREECEQSPARSLCCHLHGQHLTMSWRKSRSNELDCGWSSCLSRGTCAHISPPPS